VSSGVRWHKQSNDCPHYNEHACPTCDFDGYYAEKYPDECPWAEKDEGGRVVTVSPSFDAQAYLEKTLDNIEESEAHWTAAEVRELLNDTLNLLAGKAIA